MFSYKNVCGLWTYINIHTLRAKDVRSKSQTKQSSQTAALKIRECKKHIYTEHCIGVFVIYEKNIPYKQSFFIRIIAEKKVIYRQFMCVFRNERLYLCHNCISLYVFQHYIYIISIKKKMNSKHISVQ